MEEAKWTMRREELSIYKAARTIKKKDNNLYNALMSIYSDSVFVGEISQLWPELPLLANLRCGLWYSSVFHSTCYFKSTDGHQNNCSFSTSRLNLHVALLSGQKGGCMIVDSTRKGKRFPDSMSKTIPIWACVLNRAVARFRYEVRNGGDVGITDQWDCSLHLPLWVPETEKAAIEERLEGWTDELEASGADIQSISSCLRKPLRPLWISQKTVIWLNEVPDHDSWDFTPVILVSASLPNGIVQQRTSSEFSWTYIAGAGDDEESWARGLFPSLFWKHVHDLISSGPDLCNQKVADMVEKDRVYRAQRGMDAPQVMVKPPGKLNGTDAIDPEFIVNMQEHDSPLEPSNNGIGIFWLGLTSVAVGPIQLAADMSDVDCILNCDQESMSVDSKGYLHLPMVSSKLDRFSILSNLPAAVDFARLKLSLGNRLLVCCQTGEDISVCVCLAILTSLFDDQENLPFCSLHLKLPDSDFLGTFDGGNSFNPTIITKWEMRRRLVYVCKYATTARPSRGNLKQVFAFLTGARIGSA